MNSCSIIDGKKIAGGIISNLQERVRILQEKHGIHPAITVVLVGDDYASNIYVKNKCKTAESCGIKSDSVILSSATTEEELAGVIRSLNDDVNVHGILVQLPLPKQINSAKIINLIAPKKDVDCFHHFNVGALAKRQVNFEESLIPCTPKGCLILIKSVIHDLAGKTAVVIGDSNIVGRPMAFMLLNEKCTVTVCNSKTKNLAEITKNADIIVSATGIAGIVTGDMIKSGSILIDVGINRDANGKLTGDLDFESCKNIAGFITPVPGGVGPMTIACLMENVAIAACLQNNIQPQSVFK